MSLVNSKAPDFEAGIYYRDEFGTLKLSDFRGKWVILIFYPADFTYICPTELAEIADLYPQLQKINAEVLGISTDTKYAHKAWHDVSPMIKKIAFPMVADPTGNICRSFGTYIEQEGLSLRASFIIDPDGIVKWFEIHNNDIGRNAFEIMRKLEAAQFVKSHPGEVCPASWRPGSATLKPGINLVGKL